MRAEVCPMAFSGFFHPERFDKIIPGDYLIFRLFFTSCEHPFIKKFRTSYTLDEAVEVIARSGIREGKASTGIFWWDYMAGL